jgi:hypothetical protein
MFSISPETQEQYECGDALKSVQPHGCCDCVTQFAGSGSGLPKLTKLTFLRSILEYELQMGCKAMGCQRSTPLTIQKKLHIC